MGQKYSHLRPEQLSDLLTCTEFSEEEINDWYKDFRKDCPSGFLARKDFQKIYTYIFPYGDPSSFSEHVFRAFDVDSNGLIDFREFLCALSIASRGSLEDKLAWSFRIYDADNDGFISKGELLETIKGIYNMLGPVYGDRIFDVTITEPGQMADTIFKKLDKNEDGKLSKEEFIVGAKEDSTISRVLRCDLSHVRPRN